MRAPSRMLRAMSGALVCAVALLLPVHAVAAPSGPRLLFGAYSGDPYNGGTDVLSGLKHATARHVNIVHWYQQWSGGYQIAAMHPQLVDAVVRSGRTPLITWEPWVPGAGPEQPAYSLQRIAAGYFDAYIASWATALKATGHVVYLRPMHEFNGDWYPWAGSVNGNSAATFVQAWRHMVDVFRAQGARNVRWVWSPISSATGQVLGGPSQSSFESYYPGAGYVDVLGLDGYNWGSMMPQYGGWLSFSQIFADGYRRLTALGSQPIWITEVASAPEGGDKAAWIHDMFAQARSMAQLRAIIWFNENKERDWRADATPQTAAAFAPRVRLRMRMASTVRVGHNATMRWSATGAFNVVAWTVSLNGDPVRTVTARSGGTLQIHIARPGRNRWRVTGYDAGAHKVLSRARSFRAAGGR